MTSSIYHSGELTVQARAGVQVEADRLGKFIGSSVPPSLQDFLGSQRLAIASTVGNTQAWASLLTGESGFVQAISEQTVQINATPVQVDPLRENLLQQDDIGILVIDLATRRRLRINGKAQLDPDGRIYVHTKQVYFNCPKYIQVRYLDTDVSKLQASSSIEYTKTLTNQQQQWIAHTDTFFIASYHPQGGADASHRGGYPGFVSIVNDRKIVFPDYAGNNMFNTLGNIAINPQAGLLFIDFERGSTLQLTGRTSIIWDAERVAEFIGAERLIEFEIDQVLFITNASPLHWRFGEYSPYNPV
jgi:hypothetical protein